MKTKSGQSTSLCRWSSYAAADWAGFGAVCRNHEEALTTQQPATWAVWIALISLVYHMWIRRSSQSETRLKTGLSKGLLERMNRLDTDMDWRKLTCCSVCKMLCWPESSWHGRARTITINSEDYHDRTSILVDYIRYFYQALDGRWALSCAERTLGWPLTLYKSQAFIERPIFSSFPCLIRLRKRLQLSLASGRPSASSEKTELDQGGQISQPTKPWFMTFWRGFMMIFSSDDSEKECSSTCLSWKAQNC